jgi:hypothetical protein
MLEGSAAEGASDELDEPECRDHPLERRAESARSAEYGEVMDGFVGIVRETSHGVMDSRFGRQARRSA